MVRSRVYALALSTLVCASLAACGKDSAPTESEVRTALVEHLMADKNIGPSLQQRTTPSLQAAHLASCSTTGSNHYSCDVSIDGKTEPTPFFRDDSGKLHEE